MRSRSRRRSPPRCVCSVRLPLSGCAASSGLAETDKAATMKSAFHMPPASASPAPDAVRLCNDLFPQLAVRVLDVAAQLVALLGRHLARPIRARLAIAVRLAHIVAHALAVLLLHLALRLLLALVAAALVLAERASRGKRHSERVDGEHFRFHVGMIRRGVAGGVTIGNLSPG